MKKHKKVIKIINIMLVIILISIFNNGCGYTPYYHHAAIVGTLINGFEINEIRYVEQNNNIYKTEENRLHNINFQMNSNESITKIVINNDLIYMGVYDYYNDICYLYVLDNNFNIIQKDELKDFFYFEIHADWLYYLQMTSKNFLLYKYNLHTKELIFLCEAEGKEIIEVEGLEFYVPYNTRQDIIILSEHTNKFYSIHRYDLNFVYNNKIGSIYNHEGNIFIEYDGMIYGKSTGHWSQFTEGAIVNDNKIRFASYCEIEKGEDYIGCENGVPDCICRHDMSYIWEFDFLTKEFKLLKEINESSYVIGFDNDGYYYYMNSAIYKNDTKLYDYPTIEISGKYNRDASFNTFYKDDSHVSLNYFHLYNGNVYYYYLDNSSQIKDYYE